MKASWKKHQLIFKNPSGTSRGVLNTKDSYFLILKNENKIGIGECGILRGLSADDRPDYESTLTKTCQNITTSFPELYTSLKEFPSIQFGLEMALKDLNSSHHNLFPSPFTQGLESQAINGLVWMGSPEFMRQQVKDRIQSGFRVIKMKIGAINLKDEFDILKMLRSEFSSSDIEIRVDANGAFQAQSALEILKNLSDLDIHSIEQPIAKGQWQEMARICEDSPLDIALDEELIGVFNLEKKKELLKTIRPQFIIIKPSFIGGFLGSEEWIELAERENSKWWLTSALESNIGLSAIAQWNYTLGNEMPSGLGTGSLYINNFKSPLYLENGRIGYDLEKQDWEINL